MTKNKPAKTETKYNSINDIDELLYDEKSIKLRQILAALLGFIHYTASGMAGIFPVNLIFQLRQTNTLAISPEEASWITSILLLPMGPICISSGFAMQRLPKRYLLITSFILEALAWLITYFFAETSVTVILFARLLIGVAMALASPIVPLYLAEVTHPKTRGFCISAVYMGLSVGFMVGNIIGSSFTWKTLVIASVSLTCTSLILVCYLKESYVWPLKKGDIYNVQKAFYWYRGTSDKSKLEVSKLIENHGTDTDNIQTSFLSDFKANIKLLALPLFITLVLMSTMHLSGYKVIIIYSINIISSIIPTLNVYLVTIIMDAFRIVATIVGCILIKKYPVRTLLMVSGFGTAFSHAFFCVFKYFSTLSGDLWSILSLVALALFIVLSSVGLASLPWVVCGEIFPLKVKGIGCGISLFSFYGVFFLTIKYTPLLEVYFGVIGEFAFFGCCTTIGTVIMYFLMPETKNKTLGDIENTIKATTKQV